MTTLSRTVTTKPSLPATVSRELGDTQLLNEKWMMYTRERATLFEEIFHRSKRYIKKHSFVSQSSGRSRDRAGTPLIDLSHRQVPTHLLLGFRMPEQRRSIQSSSVARESQGRRILTQPDSSPGTILDGRSDRRGSLLVLYPPSPCCASRSPPPVTRPVMHCPTRAF